MSTPRLTRSTSAHAVAGAGPTHTTTRSPLVPGAALHSSLGWHVARRAAHAPGAALAATIGRRGVGPWVDAQLRPYDIDDRVCDAMLATHMSWLAQSPAQLGSQGWKAATLLTRATLLRHLFSERVLLESLVETMGDHLYVAAVGKVDRFVHDFDATVLRRHTLGRFADLLTAALRHPALLVYLDNHVSSRQNPNENLGRELLELHTVGVGAYTEDDVRASALLLTGHTFDPTTLTYRYRPEWHHVGPLTIMGFTHPNASADAGPAVLAAYATYLARHRSTATRVCRRLAVRFVSDHPSKRLVSDLVRVYQAHDTDLRPVVRALFVHPEFTASVGHKWRRPQEWAAAAVRAGRPTWKPTAVQDQPWDLLSYHAWLVQGAGHLPRSWPGVNGYPDAAPAWSSTTTVLAAWNHAESVAGGWDTEVVLTPWVQTLGLTAGTNVWDAAAQLTLALTGFSWPRDDLAVVAAFLALDGADVPAPDHLLTASDLKYHVAEAVRMVLASPYFLIR